MYQSCFNFSKCKEIDYVRGLRIIKFINGLIRFSHEFKIEKKVTVYAILIFSCILITYIVTKIMVFKKIKENYDSPLIYLLWIVDDNFLVVMYPPIIVYIVGLIMFGISIKKFFIISFSAFCLYSVCYLTFLYLVASSSGLS